MPAFTVLHTADWHLGARLRDLDRAEEHAAFLTWLTNACAETGADLLVIAGDVFDSASPPQSALKMWYDFLAGLKRRCPACAVLVTAGNHDSPHVLEAASAPLEGMGIHITGVMPDDPAACIRTFSDKAGAPALVTVAVPFLRDRDLRRGQEDATGSDIAEQLRTGIRNCYESVAALLRPAREAGLATLVTGHLTVAGATKSDSERDIHVGNLGAVQAGIFGPEFDCVVLGHLHRPQAAGDARVRYSGSPVALSFTEWRDRKEIRRLTFENGALAASEAMEIPCARPLMRVEATADTLEASLAAVALPDSPLPAWVEVTIAATAEPPALLTERVQAALAGRHAEAVAIRRAETKPAAAAPESRSLRDLQPAEVFESVLDNATVDEAERPQLRITFQELIERHEQSAGAA